jgi:hypothetical protein
MSDPLAQLPEQERKEIDELYPKGTIEREVLEYSMGKPGHEEVHPMLRTAFKVLIGISVIMAGSSLIAFMSH